MKPRSKTWTGAVPLLVEVVRVGSNAHRDAAIDDLMRLAAHADNTPDVGAATRALMSAARKVLATKDGPTLRMGRARAALRSAVQAVEAAAGEVTHD